MAGVRRRPAAQVLRAHGQREGTARRTQRLLEAPQPDDCEAGEVAMQKVISINLNGNAYQLDESGYDRLRDYLADAERQLKENPDRVEIMADLEQAIADKCAKYLGPTKTVGSAREVDQIGEEVGPADNPAGEA